MYFQAFFLAFANIDVVEFFGFDPIMDGLLADAELTGGL